MLTYFSQWARCSALYFSAMAFMAIMLLGSSSQTWAQSCHSSNIDSVDFGVINPDVNNDKQTKLSYVCQNYTTSPQYFRLCLYIPEGSYTGVTPNRRMKIYAADPQDLFYNLYSDTAYSSVIGPPPSGGGLPVYSWTFFLPASIYSSATSTVPIYARIPAGQGALKANTYSSQFVGSEVHWTSSTAGYPSDCKGGKNPPDKPFFTVKAEVQNSCSVVTATDLEFGSFDVLGTAKLQSSVIKLRCTPGVNWRIGLSNGDSYDPGSLMRRMKTSFAPTKYVSYQLYTNSDYAQVWGNTTTDDVNGTADASAAVSKNVYGRVPIQGALPGVYADSIVVTVTY